MRLTMLTLLSTILLAGPLQANAGSPQDLYRESYAREAKGDYASALQAMDAIAAAGAAQDYVFHLRVGWLRYLSGQYAEAARAYDKAASLEPKSVEPRLGASLALMTARRWKEAEKNLTQVLAAAPGDFTATSRLAYIHYQQNQFDKAETFYRKAVGAYPANVEMRSGLAWSLLNQRKMKDARAEFEKLLRFAPDHAAGKEGLSRCP